MKIYLYFFVILFFFSCSNEQKEYTKKSYYKSGELKYKLFFKDKTEYENGVNYNQIYYYKNGNIKYTREYINGKTEGYVFMYTLDKNEPTHTIISTFINGKAHGLTIEKDKKENIYAKYLHKEGELLVSMNFDKFETGYINIIKDTTKNIGRVFYDKDFEIIKDKSAYYQVYGKDTTEEINYKCKLETFSDGERADTTILYINNDTLYSTKSSSMEVSLKPYKKGINVFFGKLRVELDTIINNKKYMKEYNYPFHHQYVYLGNEFDYTKNPK